jgi:hypothetical protein
MDKPVPIDGHKRPTIAEPAGSELSKADIADGVGGGGGVSRKPVGVEPAPKPGRGPRRPRVGVGRAHCAYAEAGARGVGVEKARPSWSRSGRILPMRVISLASLVVLLACGGKEIGTGAGGASGVSGGNGAAGAGAENDSGACAPIGANHGQCRPDKTCDEGLICGCYTLAKPGGNSAIYVCGIQDHPCHLLPGCEP